MTQLKSPQAEVGVYSIVLGNKADINGESYDADTELQAAPHIYYAQPLNEDWSLGFAINSPYGLGTEWGDTPFRQAVTEARLMYLSATAALAYRINNQLSIGASISGNYADLTLEQGLGPSPFPYYLRYEGHDVGIFGALGILWQPLPVHSFGLTYTTKSEFDLEGDVRSNLLADSDGKMDFLASARAAFGYSYRPKPGWNIEANIEWVDWDSRILIVPLAFIMLQCDLRFYPAESDFLTALSTTGIGLQCDLRILSRRKS
ncbi:MAG: outer membrane protein transport protein [Luteolibacter sp.]